MFQDKPAWIEHNAAGFCAPTGSAQRVVRARSVTPNSIWLRDQNLIMLRNDHRAMRLRCEDWHVEIDVLPYVNHRSL
jgi:hypothetical protein